MLRKEEKQIQDAIQDVDNMLRWVNNISTAVGLLDFDLKGLKNRLNYLLSKEETL